LPTTGTLATLAGTETFTNKTLTSPVIGGTPTGVGVLTSGTAVASTSGTSIDFTSIPSWVKRITVMFAGVSTNSSSSLLIQIGSGSVVVTGYSGQCNTGNALTAMSTGFMVNSNMSAANLHSGNAVINTLGSNIWSESGLVLNQGVASNGCYSGGYLTLGGTLDRVRITTVNGTDTFDAGTINILYE
jgi:hypothetical protein